MQPPHNDQEDVCPTNRRSALAYHGFGPLALLLVLFAAIDFLVPFVACSITRSGTAYSNDLNFSDLSGASFTVDLRTPASELYLSAAMMATLMATVPQQAVLVIWMVFGQGRWPIRLFVTIAASAVCYALIETQLLRETDDWDEYVRWPATIPVNLLALAGPVAAWRIWRGRSLSRGTAVVPSGARDRRFAIRDVLAVTAFTAVALALARWTALLDFRQGWAAELALYALLMAAWSTVYIVPLAWGLLAPSHARRRLVFGWIFAALWIIPGGFSMSASTSNIDLGLTLGLMLGLTIPAPISLLLWRWCGWRLT